MTQNDKQEMISYLQEQDADKVSALSCLQGWLDVQNGFGEQIEATDKELQEVVEEYLASL